MMEEAPFWKQKTLADMTDVEWESLCDGCGLCCLNKLEDWDSGDVYFTSIRCKLLDSDSCRCRQLREPLGFRARLRPAHQGERLRDPVAAADLRLPADQ